MEFVLTIRLVTLGQANRYSIRNRAGTIIGFICEESQSLSGTVLRNVLHTHRTFKADILDPNGHLLFRVRSSTVSIESFAFLPPIVAS